MAPAEPIPLPPELTGPVQHRFLSPHYDDIALSCGGIVARLARSGRQPEVAVVFGDQPDPTLPLSPFAAAMHDAWGLSAAEVIAARRREEAAAAAALGATSGNLPFRDAIYRGGAYQSNEQLFGPPDPSEAQLSTHIAGAMVGDDTPNSQFRVYAPLAVGGHVDHQLGFAAGTRLARAGWDVLFYEDLPYALPAGNLAARLAAVETAGITIEPAAVVDVSCTWDAKLAAILAYPSQLETVFGYANAGSSPAEIDAIMGAYARRVGNGTLAERVWRIVASPMR